VSEGVDWILWRMIVNTTVDLRQTYNERDFLASRVNANFSRTLLYGITQC